MRPRLTFSIAVIALAAAAVSANAAIPEEVIRAAIDRGVAGLRKAQAADGRFAGTAHGCGPTALAALTLIECGVSPNDEQLRKAIDIVRKDAPDQKATYNLALTIMLLDRLGESADIPLIQALGVRLLEGQAAEGGWGYFSPDVASDEVARLRNLIQQRVDLKTHPGDSKPQARPPLDSELIDRLKRLESRTIAKSGADIDNSNTQFALLGVWVARRNGVPSDFALRRAEAYFRATQVRGLWGYRPGTDPDERVANNCSGLLGLAMACGVVREAQLHTRPSGDRGKPPALRDPLKDALVQHALNVIGAEVKASALIGLHADPNPHRDLYFLWSVERVGMIYSLAAMGGVDWYQAGATAILRYQLPNGLWPDRARASPSISSEINSCFALLFLRQSNFAHDLTNNLRRKNSETTMRSGDAKSGDIPIAALEPSEAAKRAEELLSATPARQSAILAELRDHKGGEYTDALALVIAKLSGEARSKARDALAERLARMTPATIRSKLKDANNEVRRAAGLACSMKDDKSFVGDLIAALDDKDGWVVRASAVSLKSLTGQDFGPSAHASPEERTKSVAAWKAWWKRQSGR